MITIILGVLIAVTSIMQLMYISALAAKINIIILISVLALVVFLIYKGIKK
jgi:hypothetical protein